MALEFISIFCTIGDDDEDEDLSGKKCLKGRRITKIALHQHRQPAFFYLFNSGSKQALLNCCGVDHKVFCNLLDLFQLDNISAIGAKYATLYENQVWGAANRLKLKIQHSQKLVNTEPVLQQLDYGSMVTVNSAFKVRLTNYLIQSSQVDPVVGAAHLVLNGLMRLC
eukprot:jgi/Psemu1/18512/gm1.18512_g